MTQLGHYSLVLGIPWLQKHNASIRFSTNSIKFNSPHCAKHCTSSIIPVTANCISLEELRIQLIGSVAFTRLTKKKDVQIFALSLFEINIALAAKTTKDQWKERIPQEYHEFIDMFDSKLANSLPPRRQYDHKIKLKEGTEPPFGPLYGMSREELIVLKEYVEDNLEKGWIRASSSPAGFRVLFVKKADGSLRLCVDYRGLNAITIKNRYPLPLLRETLDRLSKAKWDTKLDFRQGYNQIRMAEGEEWKTAFRTGYGHLEYTVMHFGMTNAPATFQHFVHDWLKEYLDLFCTAYLDDILIYSDTLEEHRIHVKKVFTTLRHHNVLLKPKNCEFHTRTTTYLGLIISPECISMDSAKVKAGQEWNTPRNAKDIEVFFGLRQLLSPFYHRLLSLRQPINPTDTQGPYIYLVTRGPTGLRLTQKSVHYGPNPYAL